MNKLTTRDAVQLRALHILARMALRLGSPLRAKALLDRLGRRFHGLSGAEEARAAVSELFPAGSCLSRAVTIAAVLRGSEVVIGVDVWSSARLSAHAWLEVDGVPVDTSPGSTMENSHELARLPPQ
jgi:hypothetical protein